MAQSNTQGSGCNEENTNSLFDDRVISKLRSCSLIPRSLSDFQVFVRNLTQDSISDDIIEEVWKKIYGGDACDEAKSNLMTTEVASKEQNTSIPIHIKHKPFPTIQNDNLIAIPTSRPIDSNLKKVKNSRRFVHKISEQANQSFSKSESDVSVSKCDVEFAKVGFESVEVEPYIINSSNNQKVVSSSPQSVLPNQTNVDKRKSNCSHISSSKHVKKDISCAEAESDDSVTTEKEDSASDCEVIEVVSLNKSNLDVSSDNFNIDPGSYESDSEESVVLLCSNLKQEIKHSVNSECPIHGNNSVRSRSSFRSETICDSKGMEENIKYSKVAKHSNITEKEQQQKVRNGKKGKYESLEAEVKSLKSILVNLITTLKTNSMNECTERSKSMLPTSEGDLVRRRKNSKSNESFCGKTKKINDAENKKKVNSTEKYKTSKYTDLEQNKQTSKTPTQPHSKKKCSQNDKELYESLPETIELDSYFEDLDNKKRKKFLWREVITDTLKTKPEMQLPVEKLKRIVIAKYCYYRGSVSRNTSVKFLKYLHSTAEVIVNGGVAVYSNKQVPTISSMTKRKEQFVMKTVTTRKEYKVSCARVKK